MSKDLIKKILEFSNHIHRASNKGSCNFLVVSPGIINTLHFVDRVPKIKRILKKIKRIEGGE